MTNTDLSPEATPITDRNDPRISQVISVRGLSYEASISHSELYRALARGDLTEGPMIKKVLTGSSGRGPKEVRSIVLDEKARQLVENRREIIEALEEAKKRPSPFDARRANAESGQESLKEQLGRLLLQAVAYRDKAKQVNTEMDELIKQIQGDQEK